MNKRIYACYSPSHKPLLDRHFLPSIPEGFDVVLRRVDQLCPTGVYMSDGWGATMRNKIQLILEGIDRETEPFVFSDVDVRFYNFKPSDLDENMKPNDGATPDLKCQWDAGQYSVGFMFIRPCEATKRIFTMVAEQSMKFNSDQQAFNGFALPHMKEKINVSFLSQDRYWNISSSISCPPANLAVHHGNFVVGIDLKMQLMDSIQAKIEGR